MKEYHSNYHDGHTSEMKSWLKAFDIMTARYEFAPGRSYLMEGLYDPAENGKLVTALIKKDWKVSAQRVVILEQRNSPLTDSSNNQYYCTIIRTSAEGDNRDAYRSVIDPFGENPRIVNAIHTKAHPVDDSTQSFLIWMTSERCLNKWNITLIKLDM